MQSSLDRMGYVASSLCAVHCALGPLMIGTAGVTGTLIHDERVELLLVASAVVLALVAISKGYLRHRDGWVVLLALAGLALLGLDLFAALPFAPEPLLALLAAASLIAAHSRNALLLHRTRACCGEVGCESR